MTLTIIAMIIKKRLIPMAFLCLAALTSCRHNAAGYITLDGDNRLYYEECGQGEPLILLHGHSLDTRMWDSQVRVFSKQYRCIRFDFRGYGRSSQQSETQKATHLDDLLALMDSLNIGRAHIVGLSMGAFVAGDMLAVCPERMLSCVLVSGGIRNTPGPSQPMDSLECAQRDREIAALKEQGIEQYKEQWLETLMSSGGSHKEQMYRPLRRMIHEWSAWQPLHKEVRLFYGREAWEILSKRGKTDVPTLIVRGKNEVKGRSGQPREMQYLSTSRYEVLPDCGHMLNMEQPKAFNSLVLEFLDKVQPLKPRVLVSTDIGGTDPDDNQSMTHLLMYSDLFELEGLVSSPSYGSGSKEEILRMIGLYEQDYPKLRAQYPCLLSPDSLRGLCKQGRRGLMPHKGYAEPTEGSRWIVEKARRQSERPLWILVWGSLEDVAQALHDAPDIAPRIRVYYIGGPNKKWGVNSYSYIARNFPDLWMIENNSSYRGFITDNKKMELIEEYKGLEADANRYGAGYYDYAIRDRGALGRDFENYYKGVVKMGDTPSLLYLMNGCPDDPTGESWGGSFIPIDRSSRRVFHRHTTDKDTVPSYSVVEWYFQGPVKRDIPEDSSCFTATIDRQQWAGYYLGRGQYVLRYSPKQPAALRYEISSPIPQLDGLSGSFIVDSLWPGLPCPDDYLLGTQWYSDRAEQEYYEGHWQGAGSIRRWRSTVLEDWARRWRCL